MFLLHIGHTSAARTEPSACLNRLQRIMRPQHTGTQTVEVSSAMRLLGRFDCAELYTARFGRFIPIDSVATDRQNRGQVGDYGECLYLDLALGWRRFPRVLSALGYVSSQIANKSPIE